MDFHNKAQRMQNFMIYSSGIGALLCFGIHIATILKPSFNQTLDKWTLAMCILVIPIFIHSIIITVKRGRKQDNPIKVLLNNNNWLHLSMYIFYTYGILFILLFVFILGEMSSPEIIDGKMVLIRHNTILRELTSDEYLRHTWYQDCVKSFIPCFMFYIAFLMHYGIGVQQSRISQGQ